MTTKNNNINRTIFFFSCEWGNEHLVRYLVKKGANINDEANNGTTPILILV